MCGTREKQDTSACTAYYLPPLAVGTLLCCVAAVTYEGAFSLTQMCDAGVEKDCAAEVVACE